jgi:hypothetical protein
MARSSGSVARKLPEWAKAEAFRPPDVTRPDEWIWWGPSDDPEEAESFTVVLRSWGDRYEVSRLDLTERVVDVPLPMPSGRRRIVSRSEPYWISISNTVGPDDLAPGRRMGPRVAAGVGSELLFHRGGDELDDAVPPEITPEERRRAMAASARARARRRW